MNRSYHFTRVSWDSAVFVYVVWWITWGYEGGEWGAIWGVVLGVVRGRERRMGRWVDALLCRQ